jgi:putative membrane protein
MTSGTLIKMTFAVTLLVPSALAEKDSDFVKEASSGGLAEVELGKLAQQKGRSQAVKDFGSRMVTDHSKANDGLRTIAARKGMSASSTIGIKESAVKLKLEAPSGDTFDKAYMSSMVKDHQDDIAAFQKEADDGSDQDIKSFASKTLPTLREHLSMAQRVAAEVDAK